ncbi:DHS-like NAD/FAD-binding domain-containing protein [Daedaleopsis nitida]|nr:DHS-like NAD/FAD-binding domain-containing protein [Daedaleopsis nitida]
MPPEQPPSDDMASFVSTLRSSKNIIAVAGAGLSAASGIPTFRGAGGLWRRYDAIGLATPEAFQKNPSRVWQFYHYRREKALAAQPNAGHLAIAKFSIPSLREKIAPGSSFTLITQNVDGLSRRAFERVAQDMPEVADEVRSDAVQESILEMHGRLFDVVCTSSSCGHTELNFDSPVCPALAGTETVFAHDEPEPVIAVGGSERPQYLDEIDKMVDEADLCIVVGTSSTVYPAAGYAFEVKMQRGKVAVFNMDRSEGDRESDFLFIGPAEEALPRALGFEGISDMEVGRVA